MMELVFKMMNIAWIAAGGGAIRGESDQKGRTGAMFLVVFRPILDRFATVLRLISACFDLWWWGLTGQFCIENDEFAFHRATPSWLGCEIWDGGDRLDLIRCGSIYVILPSPRGLGGGVQVSIQRKLWESLSEPRNEECTDGLLAKTVLSLSFFHFSERLHWMR